MPGVASSVLHEMRGRFPAPIPEFPYAKQHSPAFYPEAYNPSYSHLQTIGIFLIFCRCGQIYDITYAGRLATPYRQIFIFLPIWSSYISGLPARTEAFDRHSIP
jgi:hypothetical protein